ncbi:recombinase family protein [Asticcacaulis sp. W401b]|uniref:recombinase family protein n=1 Tax=Asticcacaulis sp. W401b TaxID=3388666 RepID=UPI0039709F90
MLDTIDKSGAYFRSLTESIDTSGNSGRALMRMVLSIRYFERMQLRARTVEGQEAARAKGWRIPAAQALSHSAARNIGHAECRTLRRRLGQIVPRSCCTHSLTSTKLPQFEATPFDGRHQLAGWLRPDGGCRSERLVERGLFP